LQSASLVLHHEQLGPLVTRLLTDMERVRTRYPERQLDGFMPLFMPDVTEEVSCIRFRFTGLCYGVRCGHTLLSKSMVGTWTLYCVRATPPSFLMICVTEPLGTLRIWPTHHRKCGFHCLSRSSARGCTCLICVVRTPSYANTS